MQWSSSEGDKDVEQNLGFYNRVPKKKKNDAKEVSHGLIRHLGTF